MSIATEVGLGTLAGGALVIGARYARAIHARRLLEAQALARPVPPAVVEEPAFGADPSPTAIPERNPQQLTVHAAPPLEGAQKGPPIQQAPRAIAVQGDALVRENGFVDEATATGSVTLAPGAHAGRVSAGGDIVLKRGARADEVSCDGILVLETGAWVGRARSRGIVRRASSG